MNTLLNKLYNSYWQGYLDYVRDACTEPAAFPYLIDPEERYSTATERIMICGQETQGWGNEFDGQRDLVTVEQVCGIYRGFVWTDGYNSPYWSFVKQIKKSFPKKGFVINNIVKVGRRNKAGCNDLINDRALTYFPVNRTEYNILAPDIIIFLTGPNYDWRIEKVLGPFFKKRVSESLSCLDTLTFEDSSLPRAIRCYHPGFLRRKGLTSCYLNEIIKFCNSSHLR